MATKIKKITVKVDPTDSTKLLFTLFADDPGTGEPILVTANTTITAPEDVDENLRDAAGVTWAVNDLP